MNSEKENKVSNRDQKGNRPPKKATQIQTEALYLKTLIQNKKVYQWVQTSKMCVCCKQNHSILSKDKETANIKTLSLEEALVSWVVFRNRDHEDKEQRGKSIYNLPGQLSCPFFPS